MYLYREIFRKSDFRKVQEKPNDESYRFEILLNKKYIEIVKLEVST